jgi:GxxExxY protein
MVDHKVTTPYDDLTYRIIGGAMASHRSLGPGHRENIYQRDLAVRFTESGISFEPQKLFEVLAT